MTQWANLVMTQWADLMMTQSANLVLTQWANLVMTQWADLVMTRSANLVMTQSANLMMTQSANLMMTQSANLVMTQWANLRSISITWRPRAFAGRDTESFDAKHFDPQRFARPGSSDVAFPLRLGVEGEECVAFGRRHVAAGSPAAGERHLGEPAALASEHAEHHGGGAGDEAV
jgi:hypothetical protein